MRLLVDLSMIESIKVLAHTWVNRVTWANGTGIQVLYNTSLKLSAQCIVSERLGPGPSKQKSSTTSSRDATSRICRCLGMFLSIYTAYEGRWLSE